MAFKSNQWGALLFAAALVSGLGCSSCSSSRENADNGQKLPTRMDDPNGAAGGNGVGGGSPADDISGNGGANPATGSGGSNPAADAADADGATAANPPKGSSVDPCVAVDPGANKDLIRWPYIQNVTQNALSIAFGSKAPLEYQGLTPPKGTIHVGHAPADTTDIPASVEYLPAGFTNGLWFQQGRVTGLKAGTSYCYAVSIDGKVAAGGFRIKTAPADDAQPVHVVVIGDWGSGQIEEAKIRDLIAVAHREKPFDLFLTTGDNIYGSGTYGEIQTRGFEYYKELWTTIPLYVTHGNHDYGTDQAQPSLRNYILPENAERPEHKERYYYLEWGPLFWLGLDSEDPLDQNFLQHLSPKADRDQQQDRWARRVLEKVKDKFVIAAWHKPAHSTAERGGHPPAAAVFSPVMEKFRVPLVLQGHNHLYERSHPLIGLNITTTKTGGVTYIVTGGGGKSLYDFGPEKEIIPVRVKAYHYMDGLITKCTASFKVIDIDARQIDAFEINRCQ
ncbi:MAG: hypothetical protein GMKNLPBB_00434 [Myxococcota bacterium]|nr:hypothetical protein [Myxococcota bacterium]